MDHQLEIKTLSMMAKVFPEFINGDAEQSSIAAAGQEVSFQVAFRTFFPRHNRKDYRLTVDTPDGLTPQIYSVGLVPSELPAYPAHYDDYYITTSAGLFPDPLYPLDEPVVSVAPRQWRAVWISIRLPDGFAAGVYPVTVSLSDGDETVATVTYTVRVLPVTLPAQKLIATQWFHCDCIADVHGVPVFSEEHWSLIGSYMRLAAEHGLNMILTPVVTPPLDTEVGSERPTVQLVDVIREGGVYRFGFDRLERYVRLALSCGFHEFEISHFFTQWGATATPKVMATVDGEEKRIFGWDVPANDPSYAEFLGALIPQLIGAFAKLGVGREKLWFHISDEPNEAHLENYGNAKRILAPLVEGCHRIDALSHFAFYNQGHVETPVVATGSLTPFIEAKVPNLWCYYCCGQVVKLSNRMLAMPSARTRILGVQMYRYGITGFLQWGYNFYYSELSRRLIDPYRVTDADGSFPSGDSFSVYPYRDGAIPSLRLKVFARALEDIRLLEALEARVGREKTEELIDSVAGMKMTFTEYPRGEAFFRALYAVLAEFFR